MRIDYTPEQHALRAQLRDYFASLVTPEYQAELAVSEGGGPLSVAPDGRLEGQAPLKLDPGKLPAQPLLQALGLLGPVNLTFKDGRAAIGPIPVGPAPRVG